MNLPTEHAPLHPTFTGIGIGDPTDGGIYSFGRCWTYAWQLFIRHWGFLTVFALCYFAAALVSGFIPIVGSLAMLYAGPVLMGSAGFAMIMAERKREKAQLANLFDLFSSSRSLEVVLIGLLIMVMSLIPFLLTILGVVFLIIVGSAGGGTGGAGGAGGAGWWGGGQLDWVGWVAGSLLVVIGLVLAAIVQIRFGLAYLVCVDRPAQAGFDVMGALKESWKLTEGHTLRLLAIWLVMYLVMMASLLPLCLGYLLVVAQLTLATLVAVYFYLLPQESRGGPFANLDICPWCSYDLSATDGHLCPECGRVHPGRVQSDGEQVVIV